MKIPFGIGSFERLAAGVSLIPFKNRMVEQNPILTDNQVSAISRPALRKFAEVGTGPVRATFSAADLFDDKAFVVSGTFLHTVSAADATSTSIGELSTDGVGGVSWAPTAPIGTTPPRLFLTEGGVLWLYTDNGEAQGLLQLSGNVSNGDVVRIGDVYYNFTTGSVDASSPAGTAANPWNVLVGATTAASIQNLYDAINDSGTAGTQYSTATVEHATVRATASTAADIYVHAKTPGVDGNTIVTTETGATTAWGAATLENGGAAQLRQVQLPNDVGAIGVAHINSYVIVVPVQSVDLETLGRFYWIEPGETFIETLNFATAERAPDGVNQVGVFGNMFWLFGTTTTEPWITTGDPAAPMERYQSIMFDRGSWEGTAVQVKDSLVIVDEDGGVFQISGGQKRLSRPDIEERIRRAIQIESQLS